MHESAAATPLSIDPVSFVNPAIFVLHHADAVKQFAELGRYLVLASVSPLVANKDVKVDPPGALLLLKIALKNRGLEPAYLESMGLA